MPRVILHIGFPKTGSSAVQAFLCQNLILRSRNQPYQYFVVRKGKVLSGRQLAWRARMHPLNYLATDCSIGDALNRVEQSARPNGNVPILSNESWGHEMHHLPNLENILRNGDWRAEMVAFIRPQVDWFQSAWWQWYAWVPEKPTPEEVWRQLVRSGKCDWAAHLESFSALSGVEKVRVELFDAQKDIVSVFSNVLNLYSQSRTKVPRNLSLSPIHIELYRRLGGLRQPHRGSLDGMVTRVFPSKKKAPSIITPALRHEIITSMTTANKKLLNWLSQADAEKMRTDKRWWGD